MTIDFLFGGRRDLMMSRFFALFKPDQFHPSSSESVFHREAISIRFSRAEPKESHFAAGKGKIKARDFRFESRTFLCIFFFSAAGGGEREANKLEEGEEKLIFQFQPPLEKFLPRSKAATFSLFVLFLPCLSHTFSGVNGNSTPLFNPSLH